ncbi:cytochrome c oxidase assembly protein subunit 11 [Defluviimonas denitrificans]|jgi:cytochrome c oxidase assembly protein subunit 11|uniref:Cytochrome c oxidase assembly protein CtaG n=1 Tax=Albidovulum denitrificans TaxID=404881 RepID=A0A2S8S992_9RHOB|nr:cytochrome c oxidase assembly protein [Defluviimonas denitrificans]PQV57397.1 cytochrome c oxidase assembly protein subunit 11 [Defluviimonas denitrificans]
MKKLDGNSKVAALLVGVVVTMGALAWAAVPFYSWFCRVTGYAGTTNTSVQASDKVLDEYVTVWFDANTAPDMPWQFKPKQRSIKLKIGESGMAFYEAYNPTDETVAGTASYNVAPDLAGYYFTKIQCFCFTEQVLKPHERVEMPVVFYVDPEIVDDPDAGRIRNITLSYTFYETELPDTQASLPAAKPAGYN